jgi:hypothetical protein
MKLFRVDLGHAQGRRPMMAGLALGLLMFGVLPSGAVAQTTTCFNGGPPGRVVPVCYPDPHDTGRSEVRPDRAAQYCDFWITSGTVLPCPYARSAQDLHRPASEATTSDDPVEAEIERGNRWRQRRD